MRYRSLQRWWHIEGLSDLHQHDPSDLSLAGQLLLRQGPRSNWQWLDLKRRMVVSLDFGVQVLGVWLSRSCCSPPVLLNRIDDSICVASIDIINDYFRTAGG